MEYFFSDPQCPLLCNEWEVRKAKASYLKVDNVLRDQMFGILKCLYSR